MQLNLIMSRIESEVRNLINIFYRSFEPEMERYKYLELVTASPITECEFYSQFYNVYTEIRTDTVKKVRYFISKKIAKLNNECANKLPEIDNIPCLSNNIRDMYWETLYQSYMLLESIHPEKNEAVINTLAVELKKVYDAREVEQARIASEKLKEETINAKKVKKMTKQIDEMGVPNTNDLLDKATGLVNPEIMSLIKTAMNSESLNISEMIKKSLADYPTSAAILSTIMDSYMSTNGELNEGNLKIVVNEAISGLNIDSPEFNVLIDKIYNDILYIYEKPSGKRSQKMINRINDTFEKYKTLIDKKSFSVEELVGCIWKIANDEEKRKYIDSMEKEEISPSIIKALIKKHVPSEILAYIPIDINTIIDTMFTGDMSNISSLLDMAKGWLTATKKPAIEEKLTDAQMAELEDYYDKIMDNGVKSSSDKN